MKKQIIAFLLLLVMSAQFMAHFGYMKVEATEQQIIPNEAIRLRILANSDSEEDQALKRKVRDRVKAQIDTWVAELQSIEDARRIIQSRLPELEKTVASTLKEEGSKQTFTVKFGTNVKFPTKVYGNFLYPAGEYEAVLVKLGAGEGANWWCVLFPPLCFLDFASGTVISQEEEKVEAASVEGTKIEAPQELKVQDAAPKQEITIEETKMEKPVVVSVKKEEIVKEMSATIVEDEKIAEQEDKVSFVADEQPTEFVVEEEEPEVKFLLVEVFSSLFSK